MVNSAKPAQTLPRFGLTRKANGIAKAANIVKSPNVLRYPIMADWRLTSFDSIARPVNVVASQAPATQGEFRPGLNGVINSIMRA